jgi:hypothetical protein
MAQEVFAKMTNAPDKRFIILNATASAAVAFAMRADYIATHCRGRGTAMVTRPAPKSIDVQRLVGDAATLEVKLLSAGVEVMRVYVNQAARLSSLADDTLKAIQDDKATLKDAALKLTEFGRQNVQAFADLSRRLGASYYDELDRLTQAAFKSGAPAAKAETAAPRKTARKSARKRARA